MENSKTEPLKPRDHSQPCIHVGDGAYYSNLAGCWLCDFMIGEFSETLCPGGKEIEGDWWTGPATITLSVGQEAFVIDYNEED